MRKSVVGLGVGLGVFVFLKLAPIFFVGILYFMLPTEMLKLFLVMADVVPFVFSAIITYAMVRSLKTTLYGALVNFGVIALLVLPQYMMFFRQSRFAVGNADERLGIVEYMIARVFPSSQGVLVPKIHEYVFENNLSPLVASLDEPALPSFTQWTEVPRSELTPILLPYQLAINDSTREAKYQKDGSVLITGRLWVSPPLEKQQYNARGQGLGVQEKVYNYYQAETMKSGWKLGSTGVTHKGGVTYLPGSVVIENVFGCFHSFPYVGVREDSMRILLQISSFPSCRQGDPPYDEYREYVFVSDELKFAELEKLLPAGSI